MILNIVSFDLIERKQNYYVETEVKKIWFYFIIFIFFNLLKKMQFTFITWNVHLLFIAMRYCLYELNCRL